MAKTNLTVVREGQLVVVTAVGVQDAKAAKSARVQVEKLLNLPNGPKDVLVILAGEGTPDPTTMRVALNTLKEMPFRRLAAVGYTPSRIATARNLYKAGGETENIKVFHDEEAARTWLKQSAKS